MTIDPQPTVEICILDSRLEEWGMPDYQSEQAAAIDLHACLDAPLVLEAGTAPQLVSSGIAVHMNHPHMAAVILPRSGQAHRRGLVLGNLVGLIDADYTAPVQISVWNRNPPGGPTVVISPGERIAQMMFLPVLRPRFERVSSFSTTSERGAGGFGSTGM